MELNYNLDFKEEYDRRYESMMNSDFGMTTSDFEEFQVINFDTDNIYYVTVVNEKKGKLDCTCPDYQVRGKFLGCPCKHQMFVAMNMERYIDLANNIHKNIMSRFEKEGVR